MTPDPGVVAAVLAALDAEGVPAVVGGSTLLAAHGLVDVVNDWDVVADADPAAVATALADLPHPVRRAG